MSTMAEFVGTNMTLGLTPEQPRSWKVFLASYGVQAVAVFLLVQVAMLAPVQVATHKAYQYISLAPPEQAPQAKPHEVARVKPQPAIKMPQITPPPVVETARLRVPEAIHRVEQPVP